MIQVINKFNLFNDIDSQGIANFVNALFQLDYKKTDLKYIDKKTKKEVELDIDSLVKQINSKIETFTSQHIANTFNGLTTLFLYDNENINNNYEQLKDVINNLINKFIEKIQQEIQQNQNLITDEGYYNFARNYYYLKYVCNLNYIVNIKNNNIINIINNKISSLIKYNKTNHTSSDLENNFINCLSSKNEYNKNNIKSEETIDTSLYNYLWIVKK